MKKWDLTDVDPDGWVGRLVGLTWQAGSPHEKGFCEERWLWTPPSDGLKHDTKKGKGPKKGKDTKKGKAARKTGKDTKKGKAASKKGKGKR